MKTVKEMIVMNTLMLFGLLIFIFGLVGTGLTYSLIGAPVSVLYFIANCVGSFLTLKEAFKWLEK